MMQTVELPGDSEDYHLITLGVELSENIKGLTCELGLRRGGGTKFIIDALAKQANGRTHIAIDPYGNIEYEHKENEIVRLDYTNDMRSEALANIYAYAYQNKVPFIFFNLEDTEFFKRFGDGVPVYDQLKTIENTYSFIHFDAPHAYKPLIEEIDFFYSRTNKGGLWCFDDVTGYYDHDKIEEYLFKLGFKLIEKTKRKALYAKD